MYFLVDRYLDLIARVPGRTPKIGESVEISAKRWRVTDVVHHVGDEVAGERVLTYSVIVEPASE